MKIIVQDSKKRWRSYPIPANFDGIKPLRELIIRVLAKRQIKKPFYLVFEEDELIKIKQLLYHFFHEPFSRYGEIGTINNFFEFFLLADFKASFAGAVFSVVPLLSGKGEDMQTIAELTIYCLEWRHMIGHAKHLLASRPNATKKTKPLMIDGF